MKQASATETKTKVANSRRRGRGEGSITQLADGRFQARVDLGWVEGKRKRKAVYGKTREAVAKKLITALSDYQDGLPVLNEKQTVAQYLTQWLEQTASQTLRPRTFIRYGELVRIHAIPFIGKVALARLTPQHLAKLYIDCRKTGLSPRTVQFLHAVLHRALRQALQWELIARNPADAVQAPRVARKDIQPLTTEQLDQLLIAASGDRLEALYALAVTTGMRVGELLGLQWADIDNGRIQIRHTLQNIDKVWVLVEPKTDRSRRSVTLSSIALAALRQHQARQNEERLQAGPAWGKWTLVFCTEVGTPLDARNLLRTYFHPLLVLL
jgi:integrase